MTATAARAEQLERDCLQLRQELDQRRKGQPLPTNASDGVPSEDLGPRNISPNPPAADSSTALRPALAELSSNGVSYHHPSSPVKDASDWEAEYSKLTKRHALLEERFKLKQNAARKVRDERDQWIKYAERLEIKMKRLETKIGDKAAGPASGDGAEDIGSRPARMATSPAGEPDGVAPPANAGFVSSSTTSNPERPTGLNRSRSPRRAVSTPASVSIQEQARTEARDAGEDHATRDEPEEAEPPQELPALPRVLGNEPRVVIKQEPSSDELVVVSERSVHKRKCQEDHHPLPPPRRIKSECSNSSELAITAEVPDFLPRSSVDLDSIPPEVPTPRKHHPPPAFETPLVDQRTPNSKESGQVDGRDSTVRRPMKPNDRMSATKPGWSLGSGVMDVAEDGVEYEDSPCQAPTTRGATGTPSRPGRLASLLNAGTGQSDVAMLPPVHQARANRVRPAAFVSAARGGDAADPPSKDRRDETPVKLARDAASNSSAPISRLKGGAASGATASPLRNRPPAELRLEDFKINPKFNSGYTHAYTEVVRGKAERAELSGCTDPNCCGKQFRAMAESELQAGGAAVLRSAANIKLLEEHLGDEAYRLAQMDPDEKGALWVEAKTQDLANRLGRHRHRFTRRPSPPGYWNPDFPTTQEIQEGREEGQKEEKKMVEERWKEATRGGGRWIFRDE